jgi:biopolymer transport protein ExbD
VNFRRSGRRRDNMEINVTSMIDVLLILLIFFILTTTFSQQSHLKITLPQAHGEGEAPPKPLEITIDAAGNYFVNEKAVINTQLATLLKALEVEAGGNREQPLVISADRQTPHQAVIRALDAASQLGLTHVTFAAETAGEDEP